MTTQAQKLTVPQVAEFLGLSAQAVRRMCRERDLPAIKLGDTWVIFSQDLAAWLVEQSGSARTPEALEQYLRKGSDHDTDSGSKS